MPLGVVWKITTSFGEVFHFALNNTNKTFIFLYSCSFKSTLHLILFLMFLATNIFSRCAAKYKNIDENRITSNKSISVSGNVSRINLFKPIIALRSRFSHPELPCTNNKFAYTQFSHFDVVCSFNLIRTSEHEF